MQEIKIKDNEPLEVYTKEGKKITIVYNSETKQLVVKAGNNTLKSRLVN